MPKNLLIVESPAKERTLSSILGKDFVVKSCVGHIRDLPKRELGVDVDNGFTPKYVLISGKASIIQALKKQAAAAAKIFLATDFDREGEAIAWHIQETLKSPAQKVARITFHEITPRAINEAVKNPRTIDLHLVSAQQARRIIDRLVGYKISPLLWKKIQKGLSAGRVQSVALGFIVEREKEIESFKPQEYWTLQAELRKRDQDKPFLAALSKVGEKKLEKLDLANESQVNEIMKNLEGAEFSVADIKKSLMSRSPQAPFTTASLQQSAFRVCGFTPARTMMIAQSLYEGKELPQGRAGLITYMRTDSITVAQEAAGEAAQYIKDHFGANYLVKDPQKRFKSKQKFIQEAHEAIRPTSVLREPRDLQSYLNDDELKLYSLIWVRLLASQMADQKLESTSVFIKARDCEFKATGSVVIFDGFKKIEATLSSQEAEVDEDVQAMPQLQKGEPLSLNRLLSAQHFTEPPPRFNSASLVKAMEANGVGRPSTYAPTIATLLNRHYARVDKKVFTPTDLGRKVYTNVQKHFTSIADVKFTAKMEEMLDEIASGDADWQAVLHDFWKAFKKELDLAEKNMEVQRVEPVLTDEICQKCQSRMVLRESRFGKFLSCSSFPKCDFKISLTRTGEKKQVKFTDQLCEKCQAPLVERVGRRGKFLACSKFPQCRFTKSIEERPQRPKTP